MYNYSFFLVMIIVASCYFQTNNATISNVNATNNAAGVYGLTGFFTASSSITHTKSDSRTKKELKAKLEAEAENLKYENTFDNLIYYDPSTGYPIVVNSAESPYVGSYSVGCFDNINNIFYESIVVLNNKTNYRHQNLGLFGFNLSNPNITHFIEFPMIETCLNCIGATDVCTADPNTGDIYVYGRSYYNPEQTVLVRVTRNNITLNTTTTIISWYNSTWRPRKDRISLQNDCHTFDTKRNKLWIPQWIDSIGLRYLYIDPITGIIENNVSSTEMETDLGSCIYHKDLDKIIGIGTNSHSSTTGDFSFIIKYIDPVTLEIDNNNGDIKPTDEIFCTKYGYPTLDFENNIIYQIINKMEDSNYNCNDYNETTLGYMTGINIINGNVESSVPICIIWDCPIAYQYWGGN